MRSLFFKLMLGWFGFTLSGVASAGLPSGTITFITAETAAPALPVPTLGVMAAVLLAGVLFVMALHMLRRRGQGLASLAIIGSALGAVMTVASMGVLEAVGNDVSITDGKLGQPQDFICGDAGSPITTTFTNNASSSVQVSAIDVGSCALEINSTCRAPREQRLVGGESMATVLAPSESCNVAAARVEP